MNATLVSQLDYNFEDGKYVVGPCGMQCHAEKKQPTFK